MLDFVFHNPTKLIFGRTAMEQIAENIKPYGNKVLLTYGGGSIKHNGVYDKVKKQLAGFEVAEFGGIEPNPRVETLREAIKLGKEFQPDIVLAVGGGSTLDGSKLIIAGIPYAGDPWDIVVGKAQIEKTIPLATVLTMSATGSEMNGGAVITNWTENRKQAFVRRESYPRFSICDPQNTFSLPADQTAFGAVDICAHVFEQYLNTTYDAPLQDRISEGIIQTVIENAPIAIREPENYSARANLMLSSTLALNNLIGSGVSSDWASHRIEHELSAFYDIPHGAGLAMVFPRLMEVTHKDKLPKYVQYGKRLFGLTGSDEEVAAQAIKSTFNFFESLGIKMHLQDWGITDEHFSTMVERLAGKVGERPLTADEVKTILEKCL
ncbi:MAG TPA: iron-containing alcohol dehydrogenase [bacterium]|nr:iron-containing alcohol dehydrogenase [bacterium]